MAFLLGFAALALNVGNWFHSQRELQASVDAAALAGAQDLPLVGGSVANARTTASDVLTTNIGNNPDTFSGTAAAPLFPTQFSDPSCSTSNCLAVSDTRPATGFFAGIVGSIFGTVTTHAHAQTFLGAPSSANAVSAAPIRLSQACQPSLGCTFPDNVTLNLPANQPLIDLKTHDPTNQTITGTTNSTNTMDQWLTTGYPGPLPVNNWYAVDPGQHNGVKSGGLTPDIQNGTVILVPVWSQYYPPAPSPIGSATAYYVVGFAAMKLTDDNPWDGNTKTLKGMLLQYIASGLTGSPCGTGCQNFGVFVVGLDG
jgi:hypothetical protein